jgi:GNAT superfamily N-acetyltransferase
MMSDAKDYPYETRLNIQFGPLETIDEKTIADACRFKWFNQTLCKVNDSVVRMGVFDGEYHWHKHDNDDEFFSVLEGRLLIDLEGRVVELAPRQGLVIPKGGHASDARRRTNGCPDGEERWHHSNRRLKDGRAMTVTIRSIIATDERRWRELWDAYIRFYEKEPSEAITLHTWSRIIDPASPVYSIVAEADGCGVIGMANYIVHESTSKFAPICCLQDLFVDPEWRSAGVGRKLIDWLVAEMKSKGWCDFTGIRGKTITAPDLYTISTRRILVSCGT